MFFLIFFLVRKRANQKVSIKNTVFFILHKSDVTDSPQRSFITGRTKENTFVSFQGGGGRLNCHITLQLFMTVSECAHGIDRRNFKSIECS